MIGIALDMMLLLPSIVSDHSLPLLSRLPSQTSTKSCSWKMKARSARTSLLVSVLAMEGTYAWCSSSRATATATKSLNLRSTGGTPCDGNVGLFSASKAFSTQSGPLPDDDDDDDSDESDPLETATASSPWGSSSYAEGNEYPTIEAEVEAMGGDPSFLDDIDSIDREGADISTAAAPDDEPTFFEWDGIVDEDAYFD